MPGARQASRIPAWDSPGFGDLGLEQVRLRDGNQGSQPRNGPKRSDFSGRERQSENEGKGRGEGAEGAPWRREAPPRPTARPPEILIRRGFKTCTNKTTDIIVGYRKPRKDTQGRRQQPAGLRNTSSYVMRHASYVMRHAASKRVVKYVVPYRWACKSDVKDVVPYRWAFKSDVKYMVPYRWVFKSVVKYVVIRHAACVMRHAASGLQKCRKIRGFLSVGLQK